MATLVDRHPRIVHCRHELVALGRNLGGTIRSLTGRADGVPCSAALTLPSYSLVVLSQDEA